MRLLLSAYTLLNNSIKELYIYAISFSVPLQEGFYKVRHVSICLACLVPRSQIHEAFRESDQNSLTVVDLGALCCRSI